MPGDLWMVGLLAVAVLLATGVSGWLGWTMSQMILAQEPEHPLWLDAFMPLKGRWLSLLLKTPIILLAMLITFAGIISALAYVAMLLGSLELMGVIAALAVICVGCFLLVRRKLQVNRQSFK